MINVESSVLSICADESKLPLLQGDKEDRYKHRI